MRKAHILLTSSEILVELARVPRYPRLQALFGLSEERTIQLRASFAGRVSGQADIICTVDKDFYDVETRAFCAAPGIDVSNDRELAERV